MLGSDFVRLHEAAFRDFHIFLVGALYCHNSKVWETRRSNLGQDAPARVWPSSGCPDRPVELQGQCPFVRCQESCDGVGQFLIAKGDPSLRCTLAVAGTFDLSCCLC